MKIILSMSISADGKIASEGGSEDFLSDLNWHHFVELVQQAGCFIYGRKTYETVCSWGEEYLVPLKNVTKIVLSKSEVVLKHGFIQAKSLEEAVALLKVKGFDLVIMAGGSTLNREFAKARLIDEIILLVNPMVLGQGIPLFAPTQLNIKLELIKMNIFSDNFVKLHYKVIKDEQ
jgi:dihydrofolate reductase